MRLPEQRIQLVAADPIDLGEQKLLPSVLVNTLAYRWPGAGLARWVRVRPVSVVIEDGESATWHEIPNATADTLSTMAAAGLGIALVSVVLIALGTLFRRS